MKTLAATGLLLLVAAVLGQTEWTVRDEPVFDPPHGNAWANGTTVGFSVIKNGDVYVAYYDSGGQGIGRALSPDGIIWEGDPRLPLIVRGPDPYDEKYIWSPSVLKDEGGYKMWYTGSDDMYRWSICLATSEDGITWTKYAGNPVISVDSPDKAGDPWVLRDGNLYKIWYTHYNRTLGHYVLDYATSQDGIHWTRYAGNPVLDAGESGPDSSSVRDPCVIKTGGRYEMWYRGTSRTNKNWTICYASSPDGISWTKYHDNPVLWGEEGTWTFKVWFPRVIREPERYSMWFTSEVTSQIGYAYQPIPEGAIIVLLPLIILGRRARKGRARDHTQ